MFKYPERLLNEVFYFGFVPEILKNARVGLDCSVQHVNVKKQNRPKAKTSLHLQKTIVEYSMGDVIVDE